MAEYIRFVSYLYEYQGNERKRNAGFVRYEVRGGQKKLMVVINGIRCPDERLPVYAFYRELDSCIGIRLGSLVLKGGRGSFQYSTYAQGPGGAEPECSFEDVAGIIVMGERGNPVFVTVWDDEEFLVTSFVKCRQDLVRVCPEIEKESVTEQMSAGVSESEAFMESENPADAYLEPESVQKLEPDPVSEPEPAATPEEIPVSEPEPAATPEEIPVSEPEPMKEPIRVSAARLNKKESYEIYRQTLWDKMCKIYPKVMPFPYNCQITALRIRPGDLGRFPKENWPLAKNSFILHGFFQYRYILVVRIPPQTEQYEERFMVGVPGVYSQMDNYLADMFGFHEFFGSPRDRSENGSFGFWMQEITMEK